MAETEKKKAAPKKKAEPKEKAEKAPARKAKPAAEAAVAEAPAPVAAPAPAAKPAAVPKPSPAAKPKVAKPAPAAKRVPDKTVKVTQIRSPAGRYAYQRATLKGLGLNKMNRSRVLEDTPEVRGMIERVRHLVRVEP